MPKPLGAPAPPGQQVFYVEVGGRGVEEAEAFPSGVYM